MLLLEHIINNVLFQVEIQVWEPYKVKIKVWPWGVATKSEASVYISICLGQEGSIYLLNAENFSYAFALATVMPVCK